MLRELLPQPRGVTAFSLMGARKACCGLIDFSLSLRSTLTDNIEQSYRPWNTVFREHDVLVLEVLRLSVRLGTIQQRK